MQAAGKFDLPDAVNAERSWQADIEIPDGPFLGAIVGDSGSGKTTLARELSHQLGGLFVAPKDEKGHACEPFAWPADACLLDGFPDEMPINEVLGLLSSVGFSSPPHWTLPYGALSNGEQFRANLARGLAEASKRDCPVTFDEYASLVHDVPARIGSAALSKAVRKHGMRVIVDTWRTDVLEWLEPDWVLFVAPDGSTRFQRSDGAIPARRESDEGKTDGAVPGRWVRPDVTLTVRRVDRSAWEVFRHVHYLDHAIARFALCFVAFIEGRGEAPRPAAFTAAIAFPHPRRPGWREHRTVTLPDYQGVGIGNAMSEYVASLFRATGRPYFSASSHPAMIGHRRRSPLWRVCREAGFTAGTKGFDDAEQYKRATASRRLTVGFEYTGPARPLEAGNFGLLGSMPESVKRELAA